MSGGPYTIKLLDADGCELRICEENTRREAIRSALEATREPCYEEWDRALVLDSRGVIEWDERNTVYHCRCCGEPSKTGEDCCTDDFPEPGDVREWS